MRRLRFPLLLLLLWCIGCANSDDTSVAAEAEELAVWQSDFRPNIVWIVTEDLSPRIPAFGDSTIQTPNLSRLAAEGIRFPHCFSTSGVCAPSRNTIATGMYHNSIGGNHMRVNSYTEETGLPAYESTPPPEVKMMSEVLRRNGYYCTNNAKQDYQFKAPVTAWDENGNEAHWRDRPAGQPFFAIFNTNVTHESGLFETPYNGNGYERYEDRRTSWYASAESTEKTSYDIEEHIPKDLDFPIPPYLPDNEIVRRDMWKVYNNVVEMDRQVGILLDQLEADGLMDSTIIFWYGDHGGPLPREKRLLYDSGLRVPLIVRFPDQWMAGAVDSQLVSFVDFAPTVFSLAGIEPPEYLQGQAFLGPYKAEQERNYIYAAADRLDSEYDMIRAVRDKEFKYLRNFRPNQPYYLEVKYREHIPTTRELLRMRDEGTLNEYQAQWFRQTKPGEELFLVTEDPHELHNLAADPQYADKLAEMREACERWMDRINDLGVLEEEEEIKALWGGLEQPQTAPPEVRVEDGTVTINCATEGASIGYKIIEDGEEPGSWSVYTGPFELPEGAELEVVAHRIGYAPARRSDL